MYTLVPLSLVLNFLHYNGKAEMYIHSHAGGDVILTNDSLTIPEGNSDNLCVQLIAGQGNPTMLDEALVVLLSVSLDGNAGI